MKKPYIQKMLESHIVEFLVYAENEEEASLRAYEGDGRMLSDIVDGPPDLEGWEPIEITRCDNLIGVHAVPHRGCILR